MDQKSSAQVVRIEIESSDWLSMAVMYREIPSFPYVTEFGLVYLSRHLYTSAETRVAPLIPFKLTSNAAAAGRGKFATASFARSHLHFSCDDRLRRARSLVGRILHQKFSVSCGKKVKLLPSHPSSVVSELDARMSVS